VKFLNKNQYRNNIYALSKAVLQPITQINYYSYALCHLDKKSKTKIENSFGIEEENISRINFINNKSILIMHRRKNFNNVERNS